MNEIEREHPDYAARARIWARYRDLYTGGEQFKARARDYLLPRLREPLAVYQERVDRVYYENHIGSIVDWYAATLFRREPMLQFQGAEGGARNFYAAFADDCDLKGTALSDFFRRQFIEGLITGASYVLVDFPKVDLRPANRAEEEAMGGARAYLVSCAPEEVINWSLDRRGQYEWVVLRNRRLFKDKVEDAEWKAETTWLYYDRENYRVYRGVQTGSEDMDVALADEGRHGLAKLRRVPLFASETGEGQWLLNRAGLLQLEHFNKSNALSWALTMGLFATPVIYSEKTFEQSVGEAYFVQLNPQDRFGWTEPEGHVYRIAAENLVRLQEEIYRVCYLGQAGGALSGGRQQSGLSKERDFSLTQEVLRGYGDAVKDHIKRVLKAIAEAREDNVQVGVTGLDEFDIGEFRMELEDASKLLGLGARSETLEREVRKKLALKYLCDARQDVKDAVVREIEGA